MLLTWNFSPCAPVPKTLPKIPGAQRGPFQPLLLLLFPCRAPGELGEGSAAPSQHRLV